MDKLKMRHIKTGKIILATPQWVKLTQEMRQMHLWEKINDENEVAKLKFEVPGAEQPITPAHEVVEVEPQPTIESEATVEVEPASEATNEPVEFQQDVVEEKPKKNNKK